ncbi:hypothetical protein ABNG02_11185 [Halorubrum ejinorense]|uniref:Uncharacterized protein n=1 Tax=Halorubrum ejinorense TaxID=425309 RepID=A0AAV3SXD0_9EURY
MTGVLRALATGLLAGGLVLALAGTAGFSSATTDRELTVATAPDERAYVGYDSPDEIVIDAGGDATNGSVANESETVTLVTLTNRFGVDIDVTGIEIDRKPDGLNVTVRTLPSGISPGESRSEAIVAEAGCEDAFEAEQLSVTVEVRGNDVEAVVFGGTGNRTISVTCRAGS